MTGPQEIDGNRLQMVNIDRKLPIQTDRDLIRNYVPNSNRLAISIK